MQDIKNNIIKSDENNQLQIRQIKKNIDALNKNYNILKDWYTQIEQKLNSNYSNNIIEKDKNSTEKYNEVFTKNQKASIIKKENNNEINDQSSNNINQKGKYKNNKNKNNFELNVHNINIKDKEKKWTYSLSSYNKINNTA